ncbi:MAG: wall associated protein [Pseudomonadota bacterium]|nr:wall associated protein [Pseudomonadota bacterium]
MKIRTGQALACLLLACSGIAGAQEAKEVWEEYGKRLGASQTVSPLGPTLFGDSVSLSNGALSFSATDVSIPGNSGLPVAFARVFTVTDREGRWSDSPVADWDIDVPTISGSFASQWISATAATPQSRCSAVPAPPAVIVGTTHFKPEDFWQGISLNVPGGDGGELLRTDPGVTRPTTGSGYLWVTGSGLTHVSCLPSIQNGAGEGFLAIAPDGTRYWFDWMSQTVEPQLRGARSAEVVARRKNTLHATRVQDRFGNRVDYTYTNASNAPPRLMRIAGSDGRLITFTYNAAGHISAATEGQRTWQYHYASTQYGATTLSAVVQPDGSRWTINFAAFTHAAIDHYKQPGSDVGIWRSCTWEPDIVGQTRFVGSITHPAGAVGNFTVDAKRLGRTNVPVICDGFTSNNDVTDDIPFWPITQDTLVLSEKTVTGPGLAAGTWSYAYQAPRSHFSPPGTSMSFPVCPVGQDCSIPACTSDSCAGTTKTVVTGPDGDWVRYAHGNSYRYNEGKLISVETGTGPTNILRTVINGHDYLSPVKFGTSPQPKRAGFTSEYVRPQRSTVINQQGVAFRNVADSIDYWARPVQVTRSSSLPGMSKTQTTQYHNDLALWVLGQVKSVSQAGTGEAGANVMSRTDYDARALPIRNYSFGQLQQSIGYHPDGTVASVADANGNTTTLAGWIRGVPGSITRSDGTGESATVHPSGWITATVDAAGAKTCYRYDLMGRVDRVMHTSESASACDTSAWNATFIGFTPVASSEYGIGGGHWRQTVSTGNARKVTYYDGLWRPILMREYDTANVAGTSRWISKQFDRSGRETFASYPVATASTWGAITKGVRNVYDVLDRPTETHQDSEHAAALITRTEYLPGFQRRTTNPRGFSTTERFRVYDAPSFDMPTRIDAPEGATTIIQHNPYDNPVEVTRSGPGG